MAKGWPIIGGLMIVTTVTYLNITAIKAIARDVRVSLERERKKLEAARNMNKSTSPDQPAPPVKRSYEERFSGRVKKMWNMDVEATVRRIQKADWERMGKVAGTQMKQAKDRVITSLERLQGEDSKKKSA
jgi:hypothetical protein